MGCPAGSPLTGDGRPGLSAPLPPRSLTVFPGSFPSKPRKICSGRPNLLGNPRLRLAWERAPRWKISSQAAVGWEKGYCRRSQRSQGLRAGHTGRFRWLPRSAIPLPVSPAPLPLALPTTVLGWVLAGSRPFHKGIPRQSTCENLRWEDAPQGAMAPERRIRCESEQVRHAQQCQVAACAHCQICTLWPTR